MRADVVLWLAVGFVVYVYAGYPVILTLLGFVRRRPIAKGKIEPTVSILVPAYNESRVIADKIRNVLAIDYPADRLELAVACDGPTDGTTEIVRSLADGRRIRLFDYPENRGKLHVLNDTIPHLRGEIVALSDASSMIEPGAIRALVANFADPSVGAVSGLYRLLDKDGWRLGRQEDFYWKYETMLKTREAEIGSVLGAHGSLYAIRRLLYPFPKPDTINDDYVIPMRVVQQGYRVAYEPDAVAYEDAHEMAGFSRRVRIMAGNIEQLREMKPLFRPLRPLTLFFFLSHKAGRLLVPAALLAAAAANLRLLGVPAYRALAVLQAAFYALVALGGIWQLRPKILRLPYYFCMINAATLVGMYRVIRGRHALVWKHVNE
jgi:cellulose synthase/poly-beta-1,6-N-acetylglucosamine synthase-like glycosyltransferase